MILGFYYLFWKKKKEIVREWEREKKGRRKGRKKGKRLWTIFCLNVIFSKIICLFPFSLFLSFFFVDGVPYHKVPGCTCIFLEIYSDFWVYILDFNKLLKNLNYWLLKHFPCCISISFKLCLMRCCLDPPILVSLSVGISDLFSLALYC